ncbi:hypothetical protein Nepgr_028289 [Nepenthes gracilis]|uniref:Uncharacterized protein n=1 Tax=Nepenthes gracilis TaxID=150966 RepID=A0AAD3Y4D6_NEPGR|nr:hypothetical protein Nepgr_028289 [Nepenthes gracilis]
MAGITNLAIIFISVSSLILFAFLAGIFCILRRLACSQRPDSTAGDQFTNCTFKKLLCCRCWISGTPTEPPAQAKTGEMPENIPHASDTMNVPEIHVPPNSLYTINKGKKVVVDSSESSPYFREEMEECYYDQFVGQSIGEWSYLRRCPEGTADKFCY